MRFMKGQGNNQMFKHIIINSKIILVCIRTAQLHVYFQLSLLSHPGLNVFYLWLDITKIKQWELKFLLEFSTWIPHPLLEICSLPLLAAHRILYWEGLHSGSGISEIGRI